MEEKTPKEVEAIFRELFKLHYSPLCLLALKFSGNPEEAEDVVQGVFGKLWDKRSNLEWGNNIVHYLYRATKNNAIDKLRGRKLIQDVDEDFFNDITDEASTEPDSIEQIRLSLVKEAIDRLPPRCREVFTLQKMSGLSYKEISEELNISVKTVENQMVKALFLIREHYEKTKGKYGL